MFLCAADAEGTREVVDVGECVDVCYGWVSGLTGLHLPPVILVILGSEEVRVGGGFTGVIQH